jgi:transcription-repair coupling factor (superfamily II helicase)
MYKYLEKIVPESRVAIAHGQMPERELEQVMIKFLECEYDVLLSTSIIESGLDMPNVNTIIINDAHKFGLSQLYQLRGRVGRSNRRAYAYLLYPQKALSESARKRLQTIKEFTDLGSGFRVAMRDLEIRGAGNILGPEQHGALSSVGFDLYCKLLSQTIAELRGEEFEEEVTPRINLEYEAYIPTTYIQDTKQRFSIYKKMTLAESEEDLHKVEEELRDRYGALPNEVKRLLHLMDLRWVAKKLRIPNIETFDHTLVVELPEKLIPHLKDHRKVKMNKASNQLLFPWNKEKGEKVIQFVKRFLLELLHH